MKYIIRAFGEFINFILNVFVLSYDYEKKRRFCSLQSGHIFNKNLHRCYGCHHSSMTFEPRREKTGLRGFRPGLTQTGLYSHRSRLEA